MNVYRIFIALFCISAGLAIAGTIAGPVLVGTSLEEFAPPDSIYNYQPPPFSLPVIGDFVWAFVQTVSWLRRTPQILAAIAAALGAPPVIVNILLSLTVISFAAFVIWIVSGRPLKA